MAPLAPPNYTQIPNEILDRMDEMTPAEFKVLMAICRKTFGWHKERDVISLTQLEDITKLSRTAVQAGIMAAIKRGLLERTKVGNQSFSYHLLVVSDYQSTEATSSVNGTEPVVSGYRELVASDYTQKKELNKEINGGVRAREAPEQQTVTPPPSRDDALSALNDLGITDYQADKVLAIFGRPLTPDEIGRCSYYLSDGKRGVGLLLKEWLYRRKVPPGPRKAGATYRPPMAPAPIIDPEVIARHEAELKAEMDADGTTARMEEEQRRMEELQALEAERRAKERALAEDRERELSIPFAERLAAARRNHTASKSAPR